MWKRYLDDCFIIWEYDEDKLLEFKYFLNTLDNDIKFTIETDTQQISFLDILVKKTGEKINTDIFYKPTDTHQYLHFGSCHPSHTKRSIPYNLARRICTIVSEENIRKTRLAEPATFLQKQKYPKGIIKDGIEKSLKLDRKQLLETKQNENPKRILPLITTHNPRNTNIYPTVKNLNKILVGDQKMKKIIEQSKIINSKRQPKNLKRILCKPKLQTGEEFKVKKCKEPRCGTCDILLEGHSYDFNGKQFKINSPMSCTSQNVIYVITCPGCNEFYIGETGNQIRARVRVHKQHINTPEYRKIKLSEHLDTCGQKKFNLFPFYKMYTETILERKEKEKYFIKLFKPKLNSLI